jgi:predicted DNA-binding ArsR family transcriptional regulator
MLTIKEGDMIVVELGYKNYIMGNKDAVALAELLSKAELYESIWIRPEDRNGGADHTYHIYPNDQQVGMKLISDDFYRMAKLAGKPEKK